MRLSFSFFHFLSLFHSFSLSVSLSLFVSVSPSPSSLSVTTQTHCLSLVYVTGANPCVSLLQMRIHKPLSLFATTELLLRDWLSYLEVSVFPGQEKLARFHAHCHGTLEVALAQHASRVNVPRHFVANEPGNAAHQRHHPRTRQFKKKRKWTVKKAHGTTSYEFESAFRMKVWVVHRVCRECEEWVQRG